MVRIGDKVRKPVTGLISQNSAPGNHPISRTGTVVWIHPEGRYYVAEFRNGDSSVRECYYPEG